jgi:hypothetical protein
MTATTTAVGMLAIKITGPVVPGVAATAVIVKTATTEAIDNMEGTTTATTDTMTPNPVMSGSGIMGNLHAMRGTEETTRIECRLTEKGDKGTVCYIKEATVDRVKTSETGENTDGVHPTETTKGNALLEK